MFTRLLQKSQSAPVDLNLFVKPSPERLSHKHWRLVAQYPIRFNHLSGLCSPYR